MGMNRVLEMKAEPENADACLGPQGLFPAWYAAAPCGIELEVSPLENFIKIWMKNNLLPKRMKYFPSFTF